MERITDAEAIEFLYDLLETTDHKVRHEEAVEYAVDAIEKQSMVNEILNEAEQYKLALFGVIRNSKVMPVGIAQGRSMEEIDIMSLKTLEEVINICNFDALKQLYEDAEEALAKMGGKA